MAINTNDENTSVFYSINKARYEILRESFGNDTPIKKINFFVDGFKLFEPFRQGHMKNVCDEIVSKKLIENLAAQFFNWVVHYRRFFNSIGVQTSFYLLHGYHGKNSPSWWASSYYDELDETTRRLLDFTVNKRIRPLAVYIPDIHVVDTDSFLIANGCQPVDRIVVPQLLRLQGIISPKEHSIIMTSDLPMMQHIYAQKRTHVMRVSHRSCNFITKSKLFEFLSKDYKTIVEDLPDTLLPYFFAINGDKNCPPLDTKLKKAKSLKVLQELLSLDADEVNDSSTVYDIIAPHLAVNNDSQRLEFMERVDYFSLANIYNGMSPTDKLAITDQVLENAPDFQTAADLNTTRFGDMIELNRLF